MHFRKSLQTILKTHGKVAASSAKAVSFETQKARQEILEAGFKKLWKLGFHLPDVRGFKERHMMALGHAWEKEGHSPSTIQNRISIFRTFSQWIGKQGMIRDSKYYVQNEASVIRQIVAKTDKSWSAKNISLDDKLPAIEAKDKFVSIQLELQRAFGLRMKEASLLRPHMADKSHYLAVNWGTKGGRDRVVSIENNYQRDVLDRAKALVNRNDSMIPKSYNFKQWRDHYYYVCRKHGISREDGITCHGLRHERFQELYHQITGCESPVKSIEGVQPSAHVDLGLDKAARQEIAEVAGHSRSSIASAYIGS